MPGMWFEIGVILMLLLINGVFAMSEIAVVTARRSRLEQRADAGDRGAATALALAREPTQFLATVQVGITLVGILAGAFGGATLAAPLAEWLRDLPRIEASAQPIALAMVVGSITYVSLIVGELVPKRIALGAPEAIAGAIARPMRVLSRIIAPPVKLLTGSTNLMLKLLGVRPHMEPSITEEEIRAALEQAAEAGVVPASEHQMVESVFRLGDRTVRAIMTPRPDLDWIDLEEGGDGEALARQLTGRRRALFLVCEESVDRVVGFAPAEELLAHCLAGQPLDASAVRGVVRPPLFVPSSMPVLQLVDRLRDARQHAALVLDEYGGVAGIVTLHDILEELVGDLPSVPEEEPQFVQREDGSWLVDGATAIGDVEARLDVSLRSGVPGAYETLAGFVLARLGRVPRTADRFDWAGHRFEVVDMDGRRVDRVLIAPTPEVLNSRTSLAAPAP